MDPVGCDGGHCFHMYSFWQDVNGLVLRLSWQTYHGLRMEIAEVYFKSAVFIFYGNVTEEVWLAKDWSFLTLEYLGMYLITTRGGIYIYISSKTIIISLPKTPFYLLFKAFTKNVHITFLFVALPAL